MQSLDAVTFGEAMALFVSDEVGDLADVRHFTRRTAGAEMNFAVGLARLGLSVGYVGRLGDDSCGRFVRRVLAQEGIDCSHVVTDTQHATGFQIKAKVDDGSDPKVENYRRGSAASHLSPADLDRDYLLSAHHLHVTGIAPALSASTLQFALDAMELMRAAGRSVSFDPNLRPALWPDTTTMIERLNHLAARADWILPGLAEGAMLTGRTTPREIAGFYLERGAKLVVIKLGPDGAYLRNAHEERLVPGVKVARVVDTVGAGDGFAAGVISGLLEGLPVHEAVIRGTQVGAFAVQAEGDMDGLPTRAQLLAAA
jgi:2-dehydro-3-deoxygluconokinase